LLEANVTGEVIYMADVKRIPPKVVEGRHLLQRYTCTFDPNATPERRWAWQVDYTYTYHYYGTAPSLPLADKRARKLIDKLVHNDVLMEEAE
jgi:hypothetical protein